MSAMCIDGVQLACDLVSFISLLGWAVSPMAVGQRAGGLRSLGSDARVVVNAASRW